MCQLELLSANETSDGSMNFFPHFFLIFTLLQHKLIRTNNTLLKVVIKFRVIKKSSVSIRVKMLLVSIEFILRLCVVHIEFILVSLCGTYRVQPCVSVWYISSSALCLCVVHIEFILVSLCDTYRV